REAKERLRIALPAVAEQVEVGGVDRATVGADVDFPPAGRGIAGDQAARQGQRALTNVDAATDNGGGIAADRAVVQGHRAHFNVDAAARAGGIAADRAVVQD